MAYGQWGSSNPGGAPNPVGTPLTPAQQAVMATQAAYAAQQGIGNQYQPGPSGYGSQAPAPAPAPATPAAPAPPPAPFLTGEQQSALDNALSSLNQQIIGLQGSFAKEASTVHFEAGNAGSNGGLDNSGTIYQGMVQNRANSNDSLEARGLGQSSIRDGDLADIEAKASAQREQLLGQLSIDQANEGQQLANLNSAISNTQTSYNQQAVQNAQGLPVTP